MSQQEAAVFTSTNHPPVANQPEPPAKKELEYDEDEDISVLDLLEDSGGPSQVQIDDWKRVYGEVYCSGFSDAELFVWRPLRRSEWRKLQEAIATGEIDALRQEELIVETTILYPALEQGGVSLLENKGGTISTLAEQVMQNSNFLNPQLALRLVQKL